MIEDPSLARDYRCTLPDTYYVDTGNVCNLRCPFCPTGVRSNRLTSGLMSRETFDTVFPKISPHARIVGLYNWGEPFLNKNLLYMASRCAQAGIRSQIDSNLTLRDFSDEEAEAIVSSGVGQITASIDGATQQTYEKYRVGGSLDRALRNLSQILRAKERLGAANPDLSWSYLINRFSEPEMDRAREMADEIGVPIDFKLMSCAPSWFSTLHQQGEEDAEARDPRERPVGFAPTPLPSGLAALKLHPRLPAWCSQPFNLMVVNWDGRVMPCCTVYGDEYALGDLTKDSIEVVWNSLSYRSCRRFLHHYGPEQHSDSVCGTLPCPVTQKHVLQSAAPPPVA